MSLAECGHPGWGVHNCHNRRDVSIACGNRTCKCFVTVFISLMFAPLLQLCYVEISVHTCINFSFDIRLVQLISTCACI